MGAGALVGVGTAGYAQKSATWLSNEDKELRLPNWTADGFKLVALADVHVNHVHDMERAREAVRLAIAQQPDALVVVGDFANTSKFFALDHIKWTFEDLARVSFPCIAVMGNHDYWTEQPRKIIAALQETPLKLLRNETHSFNGVTFAGVDDAIAKKDRYDFFGGRGSKNLISLLHEPDYVENMPEGVSLQVSGHSHGGQLCLPLGIPLHLPKGARKYFSGFYPDAKAPLYVTRGIGTIGVDLRLFCRPELSVLTLRSA